MQRPKTVPETYSTFLDSDISIEYTQLRIVVNKFTNLNGLVYFGRRILILDKVNWQRQLEFLAGEWDVSHKPLSAPMYVPPLVNFGGFLE